MNWSAFFGCSIGVLAGIVITIILCKVCNKNGKIKTEYDERQELQRGKSYKYAFYAMTGYSALLIVLSIADIELPIDKAIELFSVLLVGIMTLTTSEIFTDSYWGLNNSRKKVSIAMILIGLFNFFIAALAYKDGRLIVDDKLSVTGLNLLCGIMFVIMGIEFLVKNLLDKKKEKEEDEDEES